MKSPVEIVFAWIERKIKEIDDSGRYCRVQKKVKFTKRVANKVIQSLKSKNGWEQVKYFCEHCRKYHLTSQTREKTRKIAGYQKKNDARKQLQLKNTPIQTLVQDRLKELTTKNKIR